MSLDSDIGTVDSTTSPAAPTFTPPGDFTTSAFFTSPSTWMTLATYLLPLINPLLGGKDVSEQAQAVANLAPVVATGVLLWARSHAKSTVLHANLELAKIRLQHLSTYTPQDGKLESRMDAVEQNLAEVTGLIGATRLAAPVRPDDVTAELPLAGVSRSRRIVPRKQQS